MIISKQDLDLLTELVESKIVEVEAKMEKEKEDDKEEESKPEKPEPPEKIDFTQIEQPLKSIEKSLSTLKSSGVNISDISSKLGMIVNVLTKMNEREIAEMKKELSDEKKKEKEKEGEKSHGMHKMHMEELKSIRDTLSRMTEKNYTPQLSDIADAIARKGETWEFNIQYSDNGYIQKVLATKK